VADNRFNAIAKLWSGRVLEQGFNHFVLSGGRSSRVRDLQQFMPESWVRGATNLRVVIQTPSLKPKLSMPLGRTSETMTATSAFAETWSLQFCDPAVVPILCVLCFPDNGSCRQPVRFAAWCRMSAPRTPFGTSAISSKGLSARSEFKRFALDLL
jgi:hypothetical protein